MSNENEVNFTLSIQGQGIETPAATGQTVRQILTDRGVNLDTPVLINGEATTLDTVIPQDSIVSASSKGKGAADEVSFTLSIQGQGIETPAATGQTVRQILTDRGVNLDTPVLINGEATTLDTVIPQDSIVSASSKGKGAEGAS